MDTFFPAEARQESEAEVPELSASVSPLLLAPAACLAPKATGCWEFQTVAQKKNKDNSRK